MPLCGAKKGQPNFVLLIIFAHVCLSLVNPSCETGIWSSQQLLWWWVRFRLIMHQFLNKWTLQHDKYAGHNHILGMSIKNSQTAKPGLNFWLTRVFHHCLDTSNLYFCRGSLSTTNYELRKQPGGVTAVVMQRRSRCDKCFRYYAHIRKQYVELTWLQKGPLIWLMILTSVGKPSVLKLLRKAGDERNWSLKTEW